MQDKTLTRRRVLVAGGTLGAAGVGSLALLSQDANAQVQIDGLNVADTNETVGSDVQGVDLSVDVEWAIDGAFIPLKVELALQVSQNDSDYYELDSTEITPTERTEDGTETLSGDIVTTEAFALRTVNPPREGLERETMVYSKVTIKAYNDDAVVAESEATDSSTLTVLRQNTDTEVSIGGEGELVVQT